MQESRGKTRWVRCPSCGHKLFKLFSDSPMITISTEAEGFPDVANENLMEIKCHSCKELVRIAAD